MLKAISTICSGISIFHIDRFRANATSAYYKLAAVIHSRFKRKLPLPLPIRMDCTISTPPPFEGRITIIIGPMFSGKTTELLRLHDRQVIARRKCVLVKYAGDTRYDSDRIATHKKITGQGTTLKAHRLNQVYKQIFDSSVQVVSIDEGQFFEDLSDTVEKLADAGKLVIIAALSGTFERKPFPQISLVLPLADEIKQVTAICVECGADAIYTFRRTMDKKVEVIGGEDTYTALCRCCYNEQSRIRDSASAKSDRENRLIETSSKSTGTEDEDDEVPRKVLKKAAHN